MHSVRLGFAAALLCAAALSAWQAPPSFRTGVDLIAVDVQVLDRSGAPMPSLRPDQFTVTIDGKRRRVVSADLLKVETLESPARTAGDVPQTPAARVDPGRVYLLAVDAMSFRGTEVAPARDAARAFVSRLRPNDFVGLAVVPSGPMIEATTDHAKVVSALTRIVGEADSDSMDQLSPSTMVDFSQVDVGDATRDWDTFRRNNPLVANKLLGICYDPPERIFCIPATVMQAREMALSLEAQARNRVSSLRAAIQSLGTASRRKVVVLVSAGIAAADRSGARPALADIGRVVGQSAAEVNAAVYTLFFDRLPGDLATQSRRATRPTDAPRDSMMLSRSLEQIADASGGAFVKIAQGSGEFAFAQVLTETSTYYLLGVEPDARDRDGRPHELRIRTALRDATVRGRSWVVLPKIVVE